MVSIIRVIVCTCRSGRELLEKTAMAISQKRGELTNNIYSLLVKPVGNSTRLPIAAKGDS